MELGVISGAAREGAVIKPAPKGGKYVRKMAVVCLKWEEAATFAEKCKNFPFCVLAHC